MIIKRYQTISNTFLEDGTLESSYTLETYLIKAEKGKLLKNTKTGYITSEAVTVSKKVRIADYIEIEAPSIPE